MIWNETKECMDRDQLHELQSARLRKQVAHVYYNVPYYRKKMQEVGLEPSDIKGIEDLHKLPFTTYEDLANTYPFGMAAVPLSECVRLQSSSGTTGKPKIAVYTRKDIDIWAEGVARCMAMAGVTKEDIVMVSYGYGLFTGGLGAHYGAEKLGALVIPMGTGNTQKLIDMMIDCKATVICCTPSYLLHITEALEEQGRLDEISLKCSINGAEPWSDEMREQIESRLGMKAYDIYGLTEIAGPGVANDCDAHRGLHIWEDHFLPEVINPETGEQLPEGSEGELVITTLTKEGFPMIRYRTRDVTNLEYDKCECGRTMARIQRFKGRSDDMLIIKGVNVFPSQVEAALLNVDGVSPNYFITVDRINNSDVMEVAVEVEDRFFSDEIGVLEDLTKTVHDQLKSAIGLNAKVRLVEPNALEHSQG
ncbi:MAG: phenylacetate--CoA ligase, partial [Clostridia bacterium]|nr:phenylacetate--CoA ligase [Clostridia bacterium]